MEYVNIALAFDRKSRWLTLVPHQDVVDASLDEVSIDITRLEEECKNIDMALRKILRDDPIPEAKLNPNNEENPWEPEDPTHGAGGLDSPPDSPPGGPAGAAAGLSPASSQ